MHTSPKARPAASPKWLYERSTRVSEVVLRSACVVHAQCIRGASAGQGTHGCPARRALSKRWRLHGARAAAASTCVPTRHTSHSAVAARSSSRFPLSDISASVEFTCERRHSTCACHTHTTCTCSASVAFERERGRELAGHCGGVRVARRQESMQGGEAACLQPAAQLLHAGQANVVVRKVERRDRRVGGQDLPYKPSGGRASCGGRRTAWREQERRWLRVAGRRGRAVARSAGGTPPPRRGRPRRQTSCHPDSAT